MVRDELIATIEKAASDLEVFVSNQEEGRSLQACIDGVRQLVGIFNLLELRGAAMLAQELLSTANDITVGDEGVAYEKRLEGITNAFFVLSRYLEYVQQSKFKVPVLLVRNINELRRLRGEPAIQESHFFVITSTANSTVSQLASLVPQLDPVEVSPQELPLLLKRLRHMYQVGLLSVLRGRPAEPALNMMRRALIRLQRLGGSDKPLTLLWWLANVTLDAMIRQRMELIEPRKLLLSRLDRVIKEVARSGLAAMKAEPPKALVKELIYLLSLSGTHQKVLSELRRAYDFEPLPYTEADLARERQALSGPSAHTVSSLARVLRTELGHTKNVLENASMSDGRIDDLDGFVQTLEKVAEILLVVGLSSPGQTLKKEIQKVRSWRAGEAVESEALQAVANTLLFVESTVASLEHTKLSNSMLAEASDLMQQEVIASGELAEAQRIVIQEAEAGLSLTMRALNSYSESGFDSGHIRNIGKTLATVRGGMFMLKRFRAAAIVERCALFVDDVLMQPQHPPAMQELLETFADAIISVEYYLDSGGHRGVPDESVLQLAEDSLQALGYPLGK